MSAPPQLNHKAPDFRAKTTEGVTIQLSELVKSGPVIIAFFPKAFTPGWRSELSALQAGFAKLQKHNGTVIAISTDDAKTLADFKQSLKAEFHFVPDPKLELVKLYDLRFLFFFNYAKRWTFVVDTNQIIRQIDTGGDAIEAQSAINGACELPRPSSQK